MESDFSTMILDQVLGSMRSCMQIIQKLLLFDVSDVFDRTGQSWAYEILQAFGIPGQLLKLVQ